jgi:hypothetical protein
MHATDTHAPTRELLGHMGPVTDPEPVNEVIGQFLERQQ